MVNQRSVGRAFVKIPPQLSSHIIYIYYTRFLCYMNEESFFHGHKSYAPF